VSWIVVQTFPLETDLSLVAGFLREKNIVHQFYEDKGVQVLAVADPVIIEPLKQFLDNFTQGNIQIQNNLHADVAQELTTPSLIEQVKAVPISGLLLVLSALGALLVYADPNMRYVHWFSFFDFDDRTNVPFMKSLLAGEIWRVITPVFLHFGFFHVLFNSLWVWDLGRRVELLLGKREYFLFFLMTSAASNIAQFRWSEFNLFGGMSGFVYALVGYIFVRHRLSPHRLTAVPPGILVFMLIWLVLCMTGIVDAFAGAHIANAAHLGGFLAGCGYAALATRKIT
jgi:GlpG protein